LVKHTRDTLVPLCVTLQSLKNDEDGQDLVEDALFVALIALLCVASISNVANAVNSMFSNFSSSLA
jgi:Flp pilus assembly pilin Flp